MKQLFAVASIYSPQTQPREVIGIDRGDRLVAILRFGSGRDCDRRGSCATTPDAFTAKFAHLLPTRIVIEVGAHPPWVSRLLQAQGHELIVANPRKVRLIYSPFSHRHVPPYSGSVGIGARLDVALYAARQYGHREEGSLGCGHA